MLMKDKEMDRKRSFLSKCCYNNNTAYIVVAIGIVFLISVGFFMSRKIYFLSRLIK